MARPREFDLDTALASAMDVFWANGYEETSLPQLLEGMSLSRGSLYKAFIDKRSLFMAVLKKYDEDVVLPAVSLLNNAEISDGTERIELLFGGVLDIVKGGDYRGCLLCTAAAGTAPNDDEISVEVHRMLEQMRSGFDVAIQQSSVFANSDRDVKVDMVNLLLTQYVGFRILARSRASITMLEGVFTSVKRILQRSPHVDVN